VLHAAGPKWFRPGVDLTGRVRLRIEREIIVSFAGQLAEAKFLCRSPDSGMDRDNKEATAMAFRVCGSKETTTAYLSYCWHASRDIVSASWQDIQTVAVALLAREALDYHDMIEIIQPGSTALRNSLKQTAGMHRAAHKR
jgi:hypothetical protein